jgi:hypothetical protein
MLPMATPRSDDLPTSDRHDFASAQWLWQPDTQPPSDADGAEEGGEDDED